MRGGVRRNAMSTASWKEPIYNTLLSQWRAEDVDAEYVIRAGEGDENAAMWLYDNYIRLVLKTAHATLQRQEDAEDVAEEILLKLFRPEEVDRFYNSLLQYKKGDSFKGAFQKWLGRCTHNKAVDYQRRKRNTLELDNAADLHAQDSDPVVEALRSEEKFEAKALLRAALSKLKRKKEQYDAVVLHFWNELPDSEIAARTGKTAKAIKQARFRGMENLRKWLNIAPRDK
jgi:RNA polymerase sigma-70 factor, ECF subfamily